MDGGFLHPARDRLKAGATGHRLEDKRLKTFLAGVGSCHDIFNLPARIGYNLEFRMRRALAKLGRCCSKIAAVSLLRTSNDRLPFE